MGTDTASAERAAEVTAAMAASPFSSLEASGAVISSPSERQQAMKTFIEMRSADRRACRRYPIDLTAHYEIGTPSKQFPGGRARVINISSNGLLIQPQNPLAAGGKIRLRIDWPVRLNGLVPLALHIEGRMIRNDGAHVGVKIFKFEFRIRPLSPAGASARLEI